MTASALVLLAAAISFNRDIRPIMSDTCFRCHGPDRNARMAGLRLDLREQALQKTSTGVIPIVPGDPDRSAIIQRIFATDARRMPPDYSHKTLTARQKETIRQWVAEGARYEGHWAYLPVRRPPVPAVERPQAPIRNPIDAFIQTRLAQEGLRPSPEADRRTLLRRVTLDLTGLPPLPSEVDAFLADSSPDAYEKVVDRLLASPHYAEKQAMHWLDAVRYADTCGFHGDNPFPAWPYRDYVLRAFRDNKPFDQFTREQLAGDLLPNATAEQKIASAYNRLTRTSAEGGIQPKEYLAKYAADRVRTTTTVWLGSTLGCAECHDHKFDPFTSRDFYSMKAFFADIKETGLVPDKGPNAWGSQIALPTEEQKRALEDLRTRLEDARRALEARTEALAAGRPAWEREILSAYQSGRLNWRYQRPLSARSLHGTKLTIYNEEPIDVNAYTGSTLITERKPGNGLVVASGPSPDNETYTVTLRPGEGVWTALGFEAVQDESLPAQRLARGSDRLVVSEVEAELSPDGRRPPQRLAFSLATSSLTTVTPEHQAALAIDGDPRTGWGVAVYGDNSNAFLALRFSEPLRTTAASVLTVRLRHDSEFRRAVTGRFRLALSSARYSWPDPEDLRARRRKGENSPPADVSGLPEPVWRALRVAEEKRTPAQKKAVLAHFQWATAELTPLVAEAGRLEAQLGRLEASIPHAVVTEADTPRETRVLPRGNWMDDSGPVVEPAIPAFLGRLDTGGRRATRLDLANWLASPENPLTARVFVNRMWRQFFGTGLSKVLDDLGSQGEWPTHPELLDWLASEFAAGWDVKRLVRTIVLSHTYRQSSASTPQLDERDPDNRLLARQSRFRVDAEVVRDIALSVSGLLEDRFGGPSVRPYQPEGYLAALNFPKRDYSASHGSDLYRRGVYTFWQRTFLHPSLLTFDAPTREECTVNRTTSNTPLQALILLNDPIYVEAARVFAQNMWKDAGQALDARLEWAFRRALSRPPTAEERRILTDLFTKNHRRFQAGLPAARELLAVGEAPGLAGADHAELAALTTVARAILNLHETITRN